MNIDLTALPPNIKLEVSKADLEAFAHLLLDSQKPADTPSIPVKQILNVKEAAALTGLAMQTVYGLTSRREIPHFKRGKALRFKHDELQAWLLANRRKTVEEISRENPVKSRKP
jgi:excisionase family DNA binding protein